MKNKFKRALLILVLPLFFIAKVYAQTSSNNLTGFNVSTNPSGKIGVNSTQPTTVYGTLMLNRGYSGYSSGYYDPVEFQYSIIYEKDGVETTLNSFVTITHSDFGLNQLSLHKQISFIIPAGYSGGYIKLKHRTYIWYSGNPSLNKWNPTTGYTIRNVAQTEASPIAPPGGPAGSYPMYAYIENSWAQYFQFAAPGAAPPTASSATISFAKFRVYPTSQPGTVPVHEWVWYLSKRPDNRDYYYSTDPYAIHVPDYGWKQFRPDRFYAYSSQVAGTVPVQRYYDTRAGKYYLSADPAEISRLNADGVYRKEGVAFYAFPE